MSESQRKWTRVHLWLIRVQCRHKKLRVIQRDWIKFCVRLFTDSNFRRVKRSREDHERKMDKRERVCTVSSPLAFNRDSYFILYSFRTLFQRSKISLCAKICRNRPHQIKLPLNGFIWKDHNIALAFIYRLENWNQRLYHMISKEVWQYTRW